eukprot:TRINITY_DN2909_c0_g1_i2.p2 TRINITY_DN2909_c0_g1~~TRINITY_DN2909_c0_g1_i2.p2  ORF type:complete len:296 (-),score=9.59 TRINITY_DN2909_c0_g1_i2:117-1004(-)
MASLAARVGPCAVSAQLGAASDTLRSSSAATPSASALCRKFDGLRLSAVAAKPSASVFVPAGAAAGSVSRGVVTMGTEAGIGVLGNKVGMLTWFTDDGKAVPCTVVGFHEGNIVTQVKTEATDGYNAVQVGYRRVREGRLSKPEAGHVKASGAPPLRHLQEFRLPAETVAKFTPGQQINVEELFQAGDLIDVSGTSIGKGFAGGIKRYNFARGPMSHGSKSHRQLGSIGAGTTPGRVYPGKKMPGQLGNETVKVRKLTVMKVDPELRAVIIKGAVPGKAGNLLRITPAKIVGKNV